MILELSPRIVPDLDEIAFWIAQEDSARAEILLGKLRAKVIRIGESPLLYQLRPEIGKGARIAAVGNYIILFRIMIRDSKEVVRIERIIHGARDLPKLLH